MADHLAFAEEIYAALRAAFPDLDFELRRVQGEEDSVDQWVYRDDGLDLCISISKGFSSVGILVDAYAFDQVPRETTIEFLTKVLEGEGEVSVHRLLGVDHSLLRVPVAGEIWESTRELTDGLADWESSMLV